MRHVCVLGGGAAGSMAALAAREAGAKVTLVRRAYGATALSSGAIDVAGWPDERPGDSYLARSNVRENLRAMLRRNPSHPLAAHIHRVQEALGRFVRAVPLYDLRQLDAPDLVLPTDLGTWKSTFLAQRSQAGANLASLVGKRVAVVGLRDWGLFHAPFVAASLQHFAAKLGAQIHIASLEIAIDDEDLPLREPHEIAARVERDAQIVARIEKEASGYDVALVPPVMGLGAPKSARICELLASERSVPGVRLQKALDRAMADAQVEVVQGDRAMDADAVVLATGRFLGGGIVRKDHRFIEPALGAPVFVDGEISEEKWLGELVGSEAAGPHPYLSAGLRVDERLRPIDEAGRPFKENLYAAGAVIGGYDPVLERCGMGTAIVTGAIAGQFAAGLS